MRRSVLLGAVMSIFLAGGAYAQGAATPLPSDQIIAIRQAMMDLQQGVAGAMKAAVEEKTEVKPLVPGAKGLVASSKVIPSMFPPGTEKGHNTKAKPEIWSNQADFTKAANNLTMEAEKLVSLAEANDKSGFATQFAAVGKACGACHREYKYKD